MKELLLKNIILIAQFNYIIIESRVTHSFIPVTHPLSTLTHSFNFIPLLHTPLSPVTYSLIPVLHTPLSLCYTFLYPL